VEVVVGDIYGGYASGLISFAVSGLLIVATYGISQIAGIVSILNKRRSEPELVYDGTVRSPNQTYYLRIKKKKGKTARNCSGLIAVLPSLMTDRETVWEHLNAPHSRDIETYADLRLFQVVQTSNPRPPVNFSQDVNFPSADASGSGWADISEPYPSASSMTVRITLVCDDARLLKKPYSRTVLDIVQNSRGQTP
jgi:hypothetical protein